MNGPLTINGGDWPGMLLEKASNARDYDRYLFHSDAFCFLSSERVFRFFPQHLVNEVIEFDDKKIAVKKFTHTANQSGNSIKIDQNPQKMKTSNQ